MPSGLIVEIADAKTSSETIFINEWCNFLLRFWFFLSHFSVTKIFEGFFPDFNNSSSRWVPSMQKKSLSLREAPLLNDLNLLTRLLFLLVIFKKVFSMRNLIFCFHLYFNYTTVLINVFKKILPYKANKVFLFLINIQHVT